MINKLLRLFSGVILFCLIYIQIGCEKPYDQLKEIQTEIKGLIRKTFLLLGPVQRLDVGVEIISNTLDGSSRSECEARDEVEQGRKHEAWVSFGGVKLQGEQGWEAVSSVTRCGSGPFDFAQDRPFDPSTGSGVITQNRPFDKSAALVGQALSIPYIVVDIEMIPSLLSGGKIDLQTTLEIRKFSSFDEKGEPVYAPSEQKRRFDIDTGNDAIVPLLVANPRERDGFNIHELYIRLSARILGQEVAAYGAISVTVDVPGLDILIDGGVVGRSQETGPTLLNNIRVGKREVRLRDLSGREAWKQVTVEKGRTVKVALKLLNLPSLRTPVDLHPIGKNPQGYEEYWRARDGAMVVKVPAGEFMMGSREDEGEPNEYPQRQVFVSEFLMDKTEVTWRQFRKFSEASGTPLPPAPLWGTPDDYAVSNVNWNEAKAYCEWAEGRLPTEAEWEKAARGTDGRQYPWGNEWDPDRCNSFSGGPHRPEGVGSFPNCLSPYGIMDLAGSVFEWCADWYVDGNPERLSRNPNGPEAGKMRVLRGGSWLYQPSWVRTAYRYRNTPDGRNVHHGFRCVQSVPQ